MDIKQFLKIAGVDNTPKARQLVEAMTPNPNHITVTGKLYFGNDTPVLDRVTVVVDTTVAEPYGKPGEFAGCRLVNVSPAEARRYINMEDEVDTAVDATGALTALDGTDNNWQVSSS